MDDVFDEDADDSAIASVEWRKLESSRKKDGFREGVEKGRELKLQTGFDDGYARGVGPARRMGKLRGILSGVLVLHMKPDTDYTASSADVHELETLMEEISEYEKGLGSRLKQDVSAASKHSSTENDAQPSTTGAQSSSKMDTTDYEPMVNQFEAKVKVVLAKLEMEELMDIS